MGIDASWITESGERKQEVFDPCQYLTRVATDRWHKMGDTKCLQFIDPWGDTTFNQAQIPKLLEELVNELQECNEPGANRLLKYPTVAGAFEPVIDDGQWFSG